MVRAFDIVDYKLSPEEVFRSVAVRSLSQKKSLVCCQMLDSAQVIASALFYQSLHSLVEFETGRTAMTIGLFLGSVFASPQLEALIQASRYPQTKRHSLSAAMLLIPLPMLKLDFAKLKAATSILYHQLNKREIYSLKCALWRNAIS
jgi:hypothetical protein